jgi:hypothetical protein
MRRLEDTAMDIFVQGRLHAPSARLEQLLAVSAEQVRAVFHHMLEVEPSLAATGKLGRATSEHLRTQLQTSLAAQPSVR